MGENEMRAQSEESKLINKLQDQWCKDNGYPIRKFKRKNRTINNRKNYKLGPSNPFGV